MSENKFETENKVLEIKVKKLYKKPELKSERILEAGLAATCNGTTAGARKAAVVDACLATSLKT